ncbi:galectin-9-like isoform X2 [Hoplias malabaricus]|uniref:galectin-9-like isoform X2 n=1 Tax=Hoplias malabaricus TaxID=27720 RepID=UPI00346240BF
MASQQPYFQPRLPFTGCIQGGLYEGKTITLSGRVLPGAERFHVNFQCGTMGSADIALHFNPRYSWKSGFVVLNTLQHSSWGTEERSSNTPIPRGSSFILTFLVNRDSYSVIVNGVHFMEYLHRLPVSRVNSISVDGGVEIESIAFQNPATPCVQQLGFVQQGKRGKSRAGGRNSWTQQKQYHAGLSQAPPPYSPPPTYPMPYKTIMQGGLYSGRTIIVQGFVNHDADRFCINLRYNSGVAFHFNPRFNENVVVRNSLLQDSWGPEERTGGMPFYRGQPFMVSIICDTQCFRIMISGAQMFTYNHRYFLLQQIDILEVEGNVSLSCVSV